MKPDLFEGSGRRDPGIFFFIIQLLRKRFGMMILMYAGHCLVCAPACKDIKPRRESSEACTGFGNVFLTINPFEITISRSFPASFPTRHFLYLVYRMITLKPIHNECIEAGILRRRCVIVRIALLYFSTALMETDYQ